MAINSINTGLNVGTFIIIGLCLIIGLLVYFLTRKIKKPGYDQTTHRAILDEMRRSFESQIYTINDRMIQNEERWKDVNHLLLKKEYSPTDALQLTGKRTFYSDFLKTNGMSENDLLIDPNQIFVLTPFHDDFTEQYLVIKQACEDVGFKCSRGDETYLKGDIFPEMLKLIVKSRLIIANINGRNSNVFYELGVAHALDKPVFLVSSQPKDIPIDIRSRRFLIYNSLDELKNMIRSQLMDLSKFNK